MEQKIHDDNVSGKDAGSSKVASLDGTDLVIHDTVVAHVAFASSTAAYHNAVGMYTYDAHGAVTGVRMLFDNVSDQGVQNGPSAFDMTLHAGEHIGFFVAPNAYSQGNNAAIFNATGGKFILIDATNGVTANVTAGHPMQLAYLAADGSETVLQTQFGTNLFTTNTNDNADGMQHSHLTVDPTTGRMNVAFEDTMGGGNMNFNDANFSINIGKSNARDLIDAAHDHDEPSHANSADSFNHDQHCLFS